MPVPLFQQAFKMLMFEKPSQDAVDRFISVQAKLPLSYSHGGATLNLDTAERTRAAGYVVDHTRIDLGRGEKAFNNAKAALKQWRHFRLNWLEIWPSNSPIQLNSVVAIVVYTSGLWWLNACRVIHVVDEIGSVSKFGFTNGTLPGHAERGEERFLIEWNKFDDMVCFSILAVSKPNHVLARIGYPFVRRLQARFARESTRAMLDSVRSASCDS